VTSPNSTNGSRNNGDANGSGVPPVLPSIPLAAEPVPAAADKSIGGLVADVAKHVKDLLHFEVELAKAEVASEVKKSVQGSVYFIVALVIALFSLFFLFFTLAELINDLGVARWGAFAIVFGLMLLMSALSGLLGYLRVRKIRKPERTITSLKESGQVFGSRGRSAEPSRPELGASAR
jgi:uncharacterized membrane protein YqjE